MARVLIVYGTKERHTATIVEHMRTAIEGRGHEVCVERAGDSLIDVPENVDAVLVGASVHAGKHQAEVREFARRNRDRLEGVPSAFFQVCLIAADPDPEAAASSQKLIDDFVEETGWQPARVESIAGKLAWTQYDFFTRLLMKLIVRRYTSPQERDTSHDVDYTDYVAVPRFAEQFADGVSGSSP